jgi:hypothetical protein
MRRIPLWTLAVVAILAVGAAVSGVAFAGGGRGKAGRSVSLPGLRVSGVRLGGPQVFGLRFRLLGNGVGIGVGVAPAASYLGLSQGDLLSQLRAGKTLAQIAGATSGKSVDGLVDALGAAAKTKLDAAVKAGKLTDAQEQAVLQKTRSAVTNLVNGARRPLPGGIGLGRPFGVELSAAASYLGLSQSDLLSQLRAGKTLAQIAGATSGKSVDGLVDALVAAAKTKLDAAVKAGKLTDAQEQTMLTDARSRITELVNGNRPLGPGGVRHGRPRVGPSWSHGTSI